MEEEGESGREWEGGSPGGGGLNISGAEKMAVEGRRGGRRTNTEREEMERAMRVEQWEEEGWGSDWMMTMEGMEKTLEGGERMMITMMPGRVFEEDVREDREREEGRGGMGWRGGGGLVSTPKRKLEKAGQAWSVGGRENGGDPKEDTNGEGTPWR